MKGYITENIKEKFEIKLDLFDNKIYIVKTTENEYLNVFLNFNSKKLQIELENNKKITMTDIYYEVEEDINKEEWYIIHSNNIYVSEEFIDDNLENIVETQFDYTKNIYNEEFKEYNIDIENKVIINKKEYNIKINADGITISSLESCTEVESIYIYHLVIEVLLIFYGFFPKIKSAKYIMQNKEEIVKYFKESEKYYSKRTNVIKVNYIKKFNEIKLDEILNQWILLKEVINLSFNGMLLSQKESSMYVDVGLCNLLQSLDGLGNNLYRSNEFNEVFPEKIENTEKTKNTEKITKYLITIIKEFKRFELIGKSECKKFISNVKFKKTHRDFHEIINIILKKYDSIFQKENMYGNKNECEFLLKTEEIKKRTGSERHQLSHMDKKTECFDLEQKQLYYYKYFIIYRLIIMDELKLTDFIDMHKLIKFKDNMERKYIHMSSKCSKCKYFTKNNCEYFNIKK